MAVAALVVSVVFGLVAIVSALYARRSASAAEAATRIEQQRRHEELTPKVLVGMIQPPTPNAPFLRLTFTLIGPNALARLDEMVVRITDDQQWRNSRQQDANGPSDDKADARSGL